MFSAMAFGIAFAFGSMVSIVRIRVCIYSGVLDMTVMGPGTLLLLYNVVDSMTKKRFLFQSSNITQCVSFSLLPS